MVKFSLRFAYNGGVPKLTRVQVKPCPNCQTNDWWMMRLKPGEPAPEAPSESETARKPREAPSLFEDVGVVPTVERRWLFWRRRIPQRDHLPTSPGELICTRCGHIFGYPLEQDEEDEENGDDEEE